MQTMKIFCTVLIVGTIFFTGIYGLYRILLRFLEKFLLGFSLGTGVLLEAAPSFTIPFHGLILAGAFSSFRDMAVKVKILPAWFTFILPDIYNNVRAVRHVYVPLLMIHSQDDQLFPLAMASKIYAAAQEPKRLVVLKGLKHNELLEGKEGEYLSPAIEWAFPTS